MRSRVVIATVIALGLATASMLLPSAPTTDPWGWLIWGREILHLDLSTAVAGSPSWKPLPVLVTTPLALLGGAAPTLWLVVSRAGALLSLAMGYRLAARLGGRSAGALAVLGLLLSTGWSLGVAHGYSEAFAMGLLFLAIDRELDGRSGQALLLGTAVALTRPEAWPLLCVVGALFWRRSQVHPAFVLGPLVAVPLLWIVPDWIGSGQFLHGSHVSQAVAPTGGGASLDALGGAAVIAPIPYGVCALAFPLFDDRGREGAYAGVALLSVSWGALLAILMFVAGYPATSRLFALIAGLVCVLGAVGAAGLAARLSPARPVLATGLMVALAAVTVGLRAHPFLDGGRAALVHGRIASDLHDAIQRAGPATLRRCGRLRVPSGMGWARGVVAWDLHVPLRRVRGVRTSVRAYVVELGAHRLDRAPPPPSRPVRVSRLRRKAVLFLPFQHAPLIRSRAAGTRMYELAADGRWTVYAVGRPPCLRRAA
ncbi:MAG: hypothetical protein ABR581_06165 [Thermoleophilaceae bacterium]